MKRHGREAELARKSAAPSLGDGDAPQQQTRVGGDEAECRYHFVEFIADQLIDCSRTFQGDLDEALLLAILAQATLRASRQPATEGAAVAIPSLSASYIAALSHIPRQTVRRKLALLQAHGWVEQAADSSWRLTQRNGRPAVIDALSGLDTRGMERAARLAAAYMNCLAGPRHQRKLPSH